MLQLSKLSPTERRAYVLADNKLAQLAGYDREMLAIELQGLTGLGFDEIEITGVLAWRDRPDPRRSRGEEIRTVQPRRRGACGRYERCRRLQGRGCLATRSALFALRRCEQSRRLRASPLDGHQADLVLTDPPFNCAIEGNVSGLGKTRHADFVMAAGEMSEAEFTAFLSAFLTCAKDCAKDGAILFVFMDHRHLFELMTAARQVGLPRRS